MRSCSALLGVLALSISLLGCSSHPPGVRAVAIDVDAVCKKLLADYDSNKDGGLSEDELESLPPLLARHRQFDTDNDGLISLEELKARFASIFDSRKAMIGASSRVTRNGKPVGGAVVHFIPADFLELNEKVMPIASGITSARGIAVMEIHPDYLPPDAPKIRGLVRPGFYLVEVTHPDFKIPAEYNTETTLGVEVSTETTIGGPINIPVNF